MFKPQILRRGFSLWTRTPTSRIVTAASHAGYETIHIQRVRVKEPFLSRSRRFGLVFIPVMAYGFLRWLDDEDDDNDEHGVQETEDDWRVQGTEEEDEDEDEDEALLFLPTGLSVMDPKVKFTPDDPTRQAQQQLAGDSQQMAKISAQIDFEVKRMLQKSPNIRRAAGNLKHVQWIKRQWAFPDGPPQTYSRPGVEYTDSGKWRRTTRPVEAQHHYSLDNAAYPAGTAKALYVHGKEQVGIFWQHLNSYNPWKDDQSEPDIPVETDAITNALISVEDILRAQEPDIPSPSAPVGTRVSASSSTAQPVPKQQATHPLGDHPLARYFPNISLADATIDLRDFRKNCRQGFKKKRPYQLPRNVVLLKFYARMVGENASISLEVFSIYDFEKHRPLALTIKPLFVEPQAQKKKPSTE